MELSEVVRIIKKGGIGILPTDTLYGVVGSALSKKTVSRIYNVKGRNEGKPLIILIPDILSLRKFNVTLSPDQKKYVQKTWPGPVSIIVSCSNKQFEYLHRGTKSLAFRMPKSLKIRNFLKKTGPIVAPSANPQGLKPASTIDEAKKYFGDKVDFYFSGGKKVGKPSKVVSLLTEKPEILRA